MAKCSCGMRGLSMYLATVVTKGDENLDASAAGEWGIGIFPGLTIAPLTAGPLVGLWASSGCSPRLSNGAIAKTPTPNPATIKANPATLLMANHPYISASGRRAMASPTGDKLARNGFDILAKDP